MKFKLLKCTILINLDCMSLRRFYRQVEGEEAVQQIFFVLNIFPTNEDCLICFESLKKNQDNVMCNKCNKTMHISCVTEWFDKNDMRKCPHCRSSWKFEIDIIEKQKTPIVLDNYSEMPKYRGRGYYRHHSRITMRGSISGPIDKIMEMNTNESVETEEVTNMGDNDINDNIILRYARFET